MNSNGRDRKASGGPTGPSRKLACAGQQNATASSASQRSIVDRSRVVVPLVLRPAHERAVAVQRKASSERSQPGAASHSQISKASGVHPAPLKVAITRPAAPAVYRPQPVPKVLQRKTHTTVSDGVNADRRTGSAHRPDARALAGAPQAKALKDQSRGPLQTKASSMTARIHVGSGRPDGPVAGRAPATHLASRKN